MIRVLVVDDSGLMRLIISDIVNNESDMEVVDTAVDGKDGLEKALKIKPDVILMDMTMGEFDGLYAIKNILSTLKVPIIILSAMGNDNMEPILEALKLGAFDYLNKPEKNKAKVREIGEDIVRKIRIAAKVTSSQLQLSGKMARKNTQMHTFDAHLPYQIVLIGSSTGGPPALEKIITQLPENMPVPVVIAQHMPPNFVISFVKRLDTLTPLNVELARKDEVLQPGFIYIAPGSRNLIVVKDSAGRLVFDYSHQKYKEFNYPSVDALFLSVSEICGDKTIAAILTGMGRDGASGMEAIYKKGGYTITQSKDTCVVYGMPREVVDRGVSKSAVPINEMAGFIVSCIS